MLSECSISALIFAYRKVAKINITFPNQKVYAAKLKLRPSVSDQTRNMRGQHSRMGGHKRLSHFPVSMVPVHCHLVIGIYWLELQPSSRQFALLFHCDPSGVYAFLGRLHILPTSPHLLFRCLYSLSLLAFSIYLAIS